MRWLPALAVFSASLLDAFGGKPGDWQAAARKVGLDPSAPLNALAESEQAAGWRLLFDGRSLEGWTGFRKPLGAGWAVEDGVLARKGPGGDIMTREEFGDFVWSAEWRISPQGNSGMFSRVVAQGDESWWTGLEMQVIHNEPGVEPRHSAGSKYDMYPPTETGDPAAPYRDATVTDAAGNPSGFNRALVVAQGRRCDFWLNGVRVVTFEIGSPDWKARADASPFYRVHPEHGMAAKGHLLFQEHGAPVWYRNIKVRPLSAGQNPYGPFPSAVLNAPRAGKPGQARGVLRLFGFGPGGFPGKGEAAWDGAGRRKVLLKR